MKKVTTNVPELRPLIRWMMSKMRLRKYDILVYFANMQDAKKHKLIPKDAKRWDACFLSPRLVWVNSRWLNVYGMMRVLGHELRHYYQFKTGRYPKQVEKMLPDDHRRMTKEEVERYINQPHEEDALTFGDWIMDQYSKERASGKVKFKIFTNDMYEPKSKNR